MLILLTGGVRTGKSTLAARMAESFRGEKHYIATMRISDEECAERVRYHRAAREGKGYVTHECPRALAELTLPEGSCILLDCLPNLLANEMFEDPSWQQDAELAAQRAKERILAGMQRLAERAARLILVTNETGEEGIAHEPATNAYNRALAALNQSAANMADVAAELCAGVAIPLKGAQLLANFMD